MYGAGEDEVKKVYEQAIHYCNTVLLSRIGANISLLVI